MTVILKSAPPWRRPVHRSTRYVAVFYNHGSSFRRLVDAKRWVDRRRDKHGWAAHPIIVGRNGITYVGYVKRDWSGYEWEVRRCR